METLVLDPGYQPVARVHWQRALTLFFQDKVEIVESYDDREVRSVTFTIKMPSVVRFVRAIRGKRKAVKFSRENIYARDQGKCQYCGSKVKRHEYTYDHVVPRSQGGKTEWTNIVVCCMPCNQRKSHHSLAQSGMKLLTQPVRPKKLPDIRVTVTWTPGMPDSWKSWITSYRYWNAELEE